MKILINAINLKVGGGVTVAMNFLKTIISNKEFHKHQYYVLAPSNTNYEEYNQHPIYIQIIPKSMQSPLQRLWLDFTWLKKEIDKINPDVVFTMGNIAVPTSVKQGVLFMYPYAIYPDEKKVWQIFPWYRRVDVRLRNMLFKYRLKYADIIFPQTETSEKRLIRYYADYIKKIKVIPTAYSKLDDEQYNQSFFEREIGIKYLLSLTKYYPHKNLEILIEVGNIIKKRNSPIKIILTINKDHGEKACQLIKSIKENGLEQILINIGQVPMKSVPSLYNKVDGLLLPTLLESFSATYVDSLTLQKPIFTSDRDFARDVCGDSAFYFDPLNAENIHSTLLSAFNNEEIMNKKIQIGFDRASSFPNWNEVAQMYIDELEKLAIK